MARAAYNTTGVCYVNDGSGGPGAVRFVADCRLVPQDRIATVSPNVGDPEAYVTYNGPISSAGDASILPPNYTVDTSTADIWEFAALPGLFFLAFRSETVTPFPPLIPYRRVFLLAL